MVQARGDAGFIEEHLDELPLALQVRMEPFDGDEPFEATSTRQAPEVHRGHPARGDLREDLVPVEPLPFGAALARSLHHGLEYPFHPD